jgi:hypothetical protein
VEMIWLLFRLFNKYFEGVVSQYAIIFTVRPPKASVHNAWSANVN